MAKKEFKPLTWTVMHHNLNTDKIEPYDVLAHREDLIKQLKKQYCTITGFSEALRLKMMSKFWSRCEYELIIEIDDNNRVWLSPWVGSRDPEGARIDVTDDENFDWKGFAAFHIERQIYKNKAKIDIYDQLWWKWAEFVDYCLKYRHKYQRRNKNEY